MFWVIPLLVAATAPPGKIETDRVDTQLLETARAAVDAKDAVRAQAALRAWSTRTVRDTLPPGLEGPAADAIAFAKTNGMLRVFASKVPGRLRVGVADPGGIVDRIDMYLVLGERRTRLVRLDGGASGRYEYPFADTAKGEVVAELVTTRFGSPLVLLSSSVHASSSEAALPAAPDPSALTANVMKDAPPRPAATTVRDAPAFPWWVIVGAGVAAALAGAGVYQELR